MARFAAPLPRRALAVFAACFSASALSSAQQPPPRAWKLLFDGETLSGWTRRGGAAAYSVEDGAIVGRSVAGTPNSFLCTEKLYGDFALELEFRVDGELNSGVQIRSEARAEKDLERVFGYQVEIDPSPRAWTAGIYDEARRGWLCSLEGPRFAVARAAFRAGTWNHVRVHAEGARLRTWLNGVPCADLLDAATLSGFVALQVHGVGQREEPLAVRWREIRIQELGTHHWRASSLAEIAALERGDATIRLRFEAPRGACAIAWRGRALRIDPEGRAGLATSAQNELVLHACGDRRAAQWNGKEAGERFEPSADAAAFALLGAAEAGLRLASVELLERVAVKAGEEGDARAYEPRIETAPADVENVAKGFELGAGLTASLVAAEPLLANPVAIALDERGAIYVAETFRQETKGVPDNRTHEEWLEDDLRASTVDERGAYFVAHHPRYRASWREEHERVRRLEDRDGDGRADRATVFAEGFNDLLDGTGAGLLVDGERVWFTCIPYLWQLEDRDRDGVAETYEPLSRGFGVRVALRGHDLHGLTWGPDGRLYFSVGDRGYDVRTREGAHLVDPESGAVFRCEPDGSQLEVFATGLRNPQELAFDAWGDLFTGDNNCDAGDAARLVHVVEGGETGWRMTYQYRDDRGPWMPEGMWQTRHADQPAFLLPPIAHVGAGPSGIAFEPGTALDERWRGKLLFCDFRGGAGSSGVFALTLERSGASFRLAQQENFVRGVLATDAEFGPDGALYVADWVAGWVGEGRGRIWRIAASERDPRSVLTAERLRADLSAESASTLVAWLADPDQRVRRRAQFELAQRGEARALERCAADSAAPLLARVHAAWALGQLARRGVHELSSLAVWLDDTEPELRTQAARVLGEARYAPALPRLIALLSDEQPRVAAAAALAVRKLGDKSATAGLVALLRANADRDLVVRHAASYALARLALANELVALHTDPSSAVRLGAVLALRHQKAAELATFVGDADGAVCGEAARAIYDLRPQGSHRALAGLIARGATSAHVRAGMRRAISSLEISGDSSAPEALAAWAGRTDLDTGLRAEAIDVLATWSRGEVRFERVHNRAIEPVQHVAAEARAAIAERVAAWLASNEPTEVRAAAARAAEAHGIGACGSALLALVRDDAAGSSARRAGLRALEKLDAPELRPALESAWAARDERLRSAADACLARRDPIEALGLLRTRLEAGTQREKQRALETLASMEREDADVLLAPWIARLEARDTEKALELDLLDAARARKDVPAFARALEAHQAARPAADPLADYLECVEGGDADDGRSIFEKKIAVGCTRCHALGALQPQDPSVLAGPDLSAVGARLDGRALLESIVEPNRVLAAGFETVYVESTAGEDWRGRVVREDERELVLLAPVKGEVREVAIPKTEIDRKEPDISGMPTGLAKSLSKRELRDLLAFLASCREERNGAPAAGTAGR